MPVHDFLLRLCSRLFEVFELFRPRLGWRKAHVVRTGECTDCRQRVLRADVRVCVPAARCLLLGIHRMRVATVTHHLLRNIDPDIVIEETRQLTASTPYIQHTRLPVLGEIIFRLGVQSRNQLGGDVGKTLDQKHPDALQRGKPEELVHEVPQFDSRVAQSNRRCQSWVLSLDTSKSGTQNNKNSLFGIGHRDPKKSGGDRRRAKETHFGLDSIR